MDNIITIDDERLVNDIISYCDINGIDDVKKFTNKLLKSAFTSEKYGFKPQIVTKEQKGFSTVDEVRTIETLSAEKKDETPIITNEPIETEESTKKPRKRKLK